MKKGPETDVAQSIDAAIGDIVICGDQHTKGIS